MSMESLSISYGKLVEVLNYPDLAIFNDDLYKINLSDIADDKEETKNMLHVYAKIVSIYPAF